MPPVFENACQIFILERVIVITYGSIITSRQK